MKPLKMKNLAQILFIALLMASISTPLAAQQGKMLNRNDPSIEWDYLDRIRNGTNLPTTVHSISAAEAASEGIVTGIPFTNDPVIRGKVALNAFAMVWEGLDVSRNMKDASLLSRFHLPDPAIRLATAFYSGSFFGTTEIAFGADSLAAYSKESGISGFWKPLDYVAYWTFPETGYLSWSGDHMTVAAGRFQTGIGLAENNILMNGQARWYDQMQFSWWSDRFRFFSLLGSSSAHLTNREYLIQSYAQKTKNSWGWDIINNHDASTQSLVPLKLFTYHRIEFKPTDKIGFGFSEMQLIGGKVPDLTNLLPPIVWHNTYTAGVSNVMAHLDTWMVPIRNLLVYGEYLMDDSRAPREDGASKPSCWGWTLGSKWVLPTEGEQWRYSLSAEYNHVDRWTYNRWQPYLTMYQRQLVTGGHEGFDIPFGHPEGGDVDQGGISFTVLGRGGIRIEAGYDYINKGPVYLGMFTKNAAYSAGSAAPQYIPVYYDYDTWTASGALKTVLGNVRKESHVFNVKAVWPISAHFEANGEIDFRLILNASHIKGKTSTETMFKTGITWTYGE